jgi:hypothetical protein
MGVRYVKRNRMEGLPNIPDPVLSSIGMTNLKFEKFDEQLVYDIINAELDIQQEKINNLP